MLHNLNVPRSIQRVSHALVNLKTKFINYSDLSLLESIRLSSFWVVASTLIVGFSLYWGLPEEVMFFLSAIPFTAIVFLGLRDIWVLKQRLQEEISALNLFANNAHLMVNSGESGGSERDILNIVPSNKLRPTVHAKELIESVAKANLNILSAPVESLLHTPRRELEGRLASALQYGSISTRLGILGTFVGLVVAIDSLGQSFEYLTSTATGTEDRESMSTTLESLSFAFVTSIWGLVGSFVISVTGRDFRRRMDEFYHAYGDAFSYGRELAYKRALSDASVHKSLVDVGRDLREVGRRLADHGETVRLGLEEQGHIVLRQAEFLKETAQGLKLGRDSWLTAVSEIESAASAMDQGVLDSLQSFEACVNETKVAFENGLKEVVRIISAETTNLRRSTESIEALSESRENKEQEAAINQTLNELKEFIDVNWRNFEMRREPPVDDIVKKLNDLSIALSESAGAQNETVAAIRNQISAVESNQETFIASISTGLRDAISELPAPVVKTAKPFSVGTFLFNSILLMCVFLVIEVEILDDPLGLQTVLIQQLALIRGSLN